MRVSLSKGKYSTQHKLILSDVERFVLYFSFETLLAVKIGDTIYLDETYWKFGKVTSKHIYTFFNAKDPNHVIVSAPEFLKVLDRIYIVDRGDSQDKETSNGTN